MNYVSKYTYEELKKILIGNIVNFKSDCQLFENFDITGKVLSIKYSNSGELLITILRNKKHYDIGCNMSNLSFEIMDSSIH